MDLMLYGVCFGVSLFACIIGKICGMGGGVIIKPVLDALGVADAAAISFVSGCTVIGMSGWSFIKSFVKGDSAVDLKISTPLAIGAAIGGVAGKELFSAISRSFNGGDQVGGIQALCLFAAVLATYAYTCRKDSIAMHRVTDKKICLLIGLALGFLGSFLGIGGGPFNVAVLFFFFSMSTKTAAQNSLYVIMVSQIFGIIKLAVSKAIPFTSPVLLVGMIVFGILGSEIGGRIGKVISEERTTFLFKAVMILVMGICLYNFWPLFTFKR